MAVFYNIELLPDFNKPVITIGTFDGVHLGHRAILNEVVQHAEKIGGESVLLTFEPHPRKVLFPNQPLGIITPLQEKLQLITDAGIQHIVVVPFTREFATLSATDYIQQFIYSKFHPASIVIGYDHRFGHDRTGGIKLLEQHSRSLNFELAEIPAQLIDEATISSTKIRHAVLSGDITEANKMLGRSYTLSGIVEHGNKLGRQLGYPTANIRPSDGEQLLPGNGIYVVRVEHGESTYGGMMSIGYNPTVTDKKELRLEVNIFDFDKEIYGEHLELHFLQKIREEQKFATLDQLTAQLHADKETTLCILLGN